MSGSDKRDLHEALPADPQHQTRVTQPEIPKEFLILFIEDLREAQQYLDFKAYTKNHPDFAEEIYYLTYHRESGYHDKILALCARESLNSELLSESAFFYAIRDYYDERKEEKIDLYAVGSPASFLVYLAHKEGYVLDKNPEAEFKKFQKFAPHYYDHFIRTSHVAVEARTVIVSNLADDVSDKQIRDLFSKCGAIKDVEIQRSNLAIKDVEIQRSNLADDVSDREIKDVEIQSERHRAVAKVIFEDLSGAKQALTYKNEHILVKSEVDVNYDKALNEYAELTSKDYEVKSKSYQAFEDVIYKYWDHCEWMVLQAMKNGLDLEW